MNYDKRRVCLPEDAKLSIWLNSEDDLEYTMAVMVKLMQEAGLVGGEYHREPVRQLEELIADRKRYRDNWRREVQRRKNE